VAAGLWSLCFFAFIALIGVLALIFGDGSPLSTPFFLHK